MADQSQRQPFRFRLPWLSAPPPAPAPAPRPTQTRPTVQTQIPRPAFESQPRPTVQTQTPRPAIESQPRPTVQTQTPRPAIESQPRPTVQTQTPTVPIQRPPFRPAGIAPVQPPPSQPQAPQRTETQQPSSSRATTEPQVTSQPASSSPIRPITLTRAAVPAPSGATNDSRVTSQPTSPPRTATTTQTRNAASLAPSPSRAAPQSRAASLLPSPSRTSQTQPASRTDTQPEAPPPSLSSQPVGRTSQPSSPSRTATQPTPTSTQSPSSVSEDEPKVARPPSPKPQPKPVVVVQPSSPKPQPIPSETISKPQNHTPIGTSSQPDEVATQPTKVPPSSTEATETLASTKKLDSNAFGGDTKPLPERKSEESEVGKKVTREKIEEEKTSGPAYEEPAKRTISEVVSSAATGLGTKIKDLQSFAFQAKHKQQEEKEETFERKETLVTTSSNAKPIKTSSSVHPKGRHTSTTSTTQKPSVISNNGEGPPIHDEVRKDISKFIQKLATGHHMEEKSVSVITLSGENRGATMSLGSESKKEGSIPIHRGYKLNPDESNEATTDLEGSSKVKKSIENQNPPSRAYVNNNVQSLNNSIVFDTSVSERNPGVHLALSRDQADPNKSNGNSEHFETHKAEFNVTPAEKRTYDPTVKRRCLRGLFMESSDSDPDNPEKPRRHGCRYDCGDKEKDKEIQ